MLLLLSLLPLALASPISQSSANIAYSDPLARNKLLPMSSAAYSTKPIECINQAIPGGILKRQLARHCDVTHVDMCSGFTALSPNDKAIILAFRGTDEALQLIMEGDESVLQNDTAWVAGGRVSKFFNDGFLNLWNGGMKDDFNSYAKQYPNYQLWITGHSLGGALASLCASFIAHNKLFPATQTVMVTFGQPRVGDHGYAAAHDKEVLNSYRVTHGHDVVAHIPLENEEGYYHHMAEVYYKKSMDVGAKYEVCSDMDESDFCSNGNLLPATSLKDHLHYFNHEVSEWGAAGCKNYSGMIFLAAVLAVATALPLHNNEVYQDALARNKMLPLSAASYADNPQPCLNNKFVNATVKRLLSVHCDLTLKDKCTGFTAISHGDQAIILAFRGTDRNFQLLEEGYKTVLKNQTAWVAGGKVSKYFNDGFLKLWKDGMKDDFTSYAKQYPNYQLWVTGHSLGGALAILAGSYVSHQKLFPQSQITVVTFGEPRTGDGDFAASVDKELPSAFRVTHSHDIVPHLPFENMEGYLHHKTESYYPKDMKVGAKFTVCADADESPHCSDGNAVDANFHDHLWYFEVYVSDYGIQGCK